MTPPESFRRGEFCRIAVRSRSSSSTGYIGLGMVSPRTRIDRGPHIGEYDAKTNAICDLSHFRLSELSQSLARSGADRMRCCFIDYGLSAPERMPGSTSDDSAEGR